MSKAVQKAIEIFGNQAALAELLGYTRGYIGKIAVQEKTPIRVAIKLLRITDKIKVIDFEPELRKILKDVA